MAAYVLFYVAVITLSKKKYDRYVLPGLVALDVLAAIGLAGTIDLALRALRERGPRLPASLTGAVASLLVLVQATLLLGPLFPAHYLAYYNPLTGGLARAVATVPVGWGEGIEQAAQYLAAKPDAGSLSVATWSVAGVAPFFPGQVVKLTEAEVPSADYVLLYAGDAQNRTPLSDLYFDQQEPEFIARLNGVEYAWLYPNTGFIELAKEIATLTAPGDVLVTNNGSCVNPRYAPDLVCSDLLGAAEAAAAAELAGDSPVEAQPTACGLTESRLAARLQAAIQGSEHVLHLEYQSVQNAPQAYIRRRLAQTALLLWEKPFAHGTMRYYQMPDRPTFEEALPSTATNIDFGGRYLLEGYGLSTDRLQYRQELGLALQWRTLQYRNQDSYLFLHLVDEQGRTWGQGDGPLKDADFLGTSTWQEDTSHVCHFNLPLSPGIPPGRYWVVMGVYNLEDMARLSISGDGGRSWSTEFRLSPVEVTSPAVPAAVEDLAIPHPLMQDLGDGIRCLGYGVTGEAFTSGEDVEVAIYWQCLQKVNASYELELSLVRSGTTVAAQRFQPAGPYHPTNRWVPGETLRSVHSLSIPADVASGDYELRLNLCVPGEGPVGENTTLTSLHVEHRERLFTAPAIRLPLQATFDDQIELLGYDLAENAVSPEGSLHLTLYWRANRRPEASYTVFTHLLDAQGTLRGQRDSIPLAGQRPTEGWVEGEIIVDQYEIPVNADAQPGTHQLEIGFYDAATGRRLTVTSDGAFTGADHVLLPEAITVR